MKLTDYLQTVRYPGRFIVLGQSGGALLAVYGATGRSPASLARQYVQKGGDVYAVAVDDTVRKEGNPALLEYRAVAMHSSGFVVANGTQGDKVTALGEWGALENLSLALSKVDYEPDQYKTPRITGCMSVYENVAEGALGIARAGVASVDRQYWKVKPMEGLCNYVATYSGEDTRPAISFAGGPVELEWDFNTAKEAASVVYEALTPPAGEADYRVGVVGVLMRGPSDREVAIFNRHSTK